MALDVESAPSQDEIREAITDSRESMDRWRFRTLGAFACWVICCVAIYPIMAGQPLHAYWESIKLFIFVPTLVAPLTFTICAVTWWGAWRDLRSLEKLSADF